MMSAARLNLHVHQYERLRGSSVPSVFVLLELYLELSTVHKHRHLSGLASICANRDRNPPMPHTSIISLPGTSWWDQKQILLLPHCLTHAGVPVLFVLWVTKELPVRACAHCWLWVLCLNMLYRTCEIWHRYDIKRKVCVSNLRQVVYSSMSVFLDYNNRPAFRNTYISES